MAFRKQWNDHSGHVLDNINGFDVIDCETCGFKHVIPIPAFEDLEKVYRHEYYTQEKPLYLERHISDLDWWNLVYGERYDTFEQILPAERRRILDVGSGPGYFLLHGQERGWQTLGIEPSARAAAHSASLGLEIVEDFLCSANSGQLGKFDVVHMSEVLEHIPDPKGMLELAKDLLYPGGLLCIVVPNDYNPFQEALTKVCEYNPWWVAPPHHVNFFDPDSLSRLFTTTGFEIVLREATFPLEMFLLMGDNYVGNDPLGRQCHNKRKLFEKNITAAGLTKLKRRLYQLLAEEGIGREVLIVGRKVDDVS
ncbi:MAG: class I SAM-dependent methyltransferase [Geobacter sp.]|nr:class I SAM-dependent methyltransferase [Geobacter sp.]